MMKLHNVAQFSLSILHFNESGILFIQAHIPIKIWLYTNEMIGVWVHTKQIIKLKFGMYQCGFGTHQLDKITNYIIKYKFGIYQQGGMNLAQTQ